MFDEISNRADEAQSGEAATRQRVLPTSSSARGRRRRRRVVFASCSPDWGIVAGRFDDELAFDTVRHRRCTVLPRVTALFFSRLIAGTTGACESTGPPESGDRPIIPIGQTTDGQTRANEALLSI
jgi:hypothetical protein